MQIGMLLSVPAGMLRFKSTVQCVLDLRYTKQLHTSVSNYWMQKSSLWITQLFGKSGMGKTFLAQSYLEAYGGQYFSFRNLDVAFAPQIFRLGCKLWREFFAEIGETKNRPVIFFDDVDDRNDNGGYRCARSGKIEKQSQSFRHQHPNHRLYQNSADTFARYSIDIILYI